MLAYGKGPSEGVLLHQGGLANVHARSYCCCCGGCRCDVHSGSGATSDATLWRADLARTSQEGHCSGGGGSPEEQLFCRHYRRGHWRVRGSYGSTTPSLDRFLLPKERRAQRCYTVAHPRYLKMPSQGVELG